VKKKRKSEEDDEQEDNDEEKKEEDRSRGLVFISLYAGDESIKKKADSFIPNLGLVTSRVGLLRYKYL
jgi:hypothetical protein